MKEIITIGVGQCGVQASNAAWELYCIEHGITCDGKMLACNQSNTDISYMTFFQGVKNDRACPRTVLADLEATVMDEIRTGAYRQLFHPGSLISGYEDAANNYARGRYTQGKTQINLIMEQIRKQVANCDLLEGFLILRGTGGGTGAGLGDVISEKLDAEFGKKTKIESGIYPGTKYSTAVVEPYNCIMTAHSAHEHTDVVLQFDNEAMYEVCKTHLHIPLPSYSNLNRILTQVLSSVTCSLRFENYIDSSLMQVQTNLVPFPKIHYLIPSYSPFIMAGKGIHKKVTVDEITKEVFHPSSHLTTCDFSEGKFMAVVLQYRGNCNIQGVNQAVNEIKQREEMQFVDWCPTGFKMGICSQPSINTVGSMMGNAERSVSCLSNHTAMGGLMKVISRKFDLLFSKRSFVHWYVGEGMEEAEFMEAKEFIHKLCLDYEECGMTTEQYNEEGARSTTKSPRNARSPRRPKSPLSNSAHVTTKSPVRNDNAVNKPAPKMHEAPQTTPDRVKNAPLSSPNQKAPRLEMTPATPQTDETSSTPQEENSPAYSSEDYQIKQTSPTMPESFSDVKQMSHQDSKQGTTAEKPEEMEVHQEQETQEYTPSADHIQEEDLEMVEQNRALTPVDDADAMDEQQRSETGLEQTPVESQAVSPSENFHISEEPNGMDTDEAENYDDKAAEEAKVNELEVDDADAHLEEKENDYYMGEVEEDVANNVEEDEDLNK